MGKYFNKEVNGDLQCVYAIWVGDFVYIGSGVAKDRLTGNVNKVKRGEHANRMLQQAYDESESKEIRTELLDYNIKNAEEAREIEDEYIKHFEKVDGVIVCNRRGAENGCTSENYNKYKRLTADKVIEIKEMLGEFNNRELAEMFECSTNTISKIRNNIRWTNV